MTEWDANILEVLIVRCGSTETSIPFPAKRGGVFGDAEFFKAEFFKAVCNLLHATRQ